MLTRYSASQNEERLVTRRGLFLGCVGAAAVAVAAAVGLGLVPVPNAEANQCAAKCRAQHNQCRIKTKGSSSCDGQLQRCLQSCLRR